MTADAVLGIDLGTTSVKAAVLDSGGQCVARFAENNPTRRPRPGYAEQDPEDWVGRILRALELFAADDLAGRVRFGGLTSQANTHLFVDAAGNPLMPAIVWQDTRAAAEAAELERQVTADQKIGWLGAPIPIDASHPLARMLWVARHRPDVWERTAYVLLPKDYALLRLTGRVVTDPLSNFGIVGPDHDYAEAMLELVPGAAERVAPLAGLTEIVGETTRKTALPGVCMANATMDGWVGLFGAGASREGACANLSGTSEILGISSHTVTNEPGVVVFAEAEGLRMHAGPTQAGAASLAWFCAIAGLDIAEASALVAGQLRQKQGRRGPTPLFLPQLAGERAPLWNADLRGAFLGLDAGQTKADFARSVFEGVAFSARLALEALERSSGVSNDTLFCGGGGFRSEPWGQIRANVLGKRLRRLQVNEPGVVGAACLAGFAAGIFASVTEAHAALAKYDRVWEPEAQTGARYDTLYGLYQESIRLNEKIGKMLAHC